MKTAALIVASTLAAGLLAPPTIVEANDLDVGGVGDSYFLNDSWSTTANVVFSYGRADDMAFFGDWDGNGTDTPMVRRVTTFYIRNSNSTGGADRILTYGVPGDVVLAGDWDGNGTDTLAVRRGNAYYIRNTLTSGVADYLVWYGRPDDVVLVGDWDGDGTDTLAVRRGNAYFIKNSMTSGVADVVVWYGRPDDVVLVGDWDGDGTDTLAVRRDNTYFIKNSLTSGVADLTLAYGRLTDTAFAGDWNGDGKDTLGVRRPPAAYDPAAWNGVDWEVLPTSSKVVALTFDGGASNVGVNHILYTLNAYNVPASFFVTGDFARMYPTSVRAMNAGFRVGNHSDTHPYFTQLTNDQIYQELARAEASISALTGRTTRPTFRFPYGDRTALDISVVNSAGYVPFRWTVDTLGWKGTSGGITAGIVCQRVLDTARPGQIVLMHVGANPDDGSTLDADALPCVIEGLRAKGYGFVSLRDFVG